MEEGLALSVSFRSLEVRVTLKWGLWPNPGHKNGKEERKRRQLRKTNTSQVSGVLGRTGRSAVVAGVEGGVKGPVF